ncbi:jg14613, partial [Pararge aegeria aegeria]
HPMQLNGTWADVLILIIGAVLQQGCTLEPRYAAGRCVTLLLFVALTILYAAYSANIVVLLRAPSSSVKTLPDLLNSPVKLGASDFEYNRYFFSKVNDPIRTAIYNKKIAPKGKKPNFYNMKEGIEKIRKGLFAFHMELNPGYRLIQETFLEEEKCDLVEMDYLNEIDPWLPGQKRSPYKDLFKISFTKIRETGVQANIFHRLQVSKPHCSGSISTFSSVGITDMYSALMATLYGVFISIGVLILEIMYKRLYSKHCETLKLTKEMSNVLNTRTSIDVEEKHHYQHHTMLFLVDLDCTESEAYFQDSKLLRSPYRWLVLCDDQNKNLSQSQILQILELPLLADSDFVLAKRNEDSFTLTELHKPSTFGPTYSNSRGYYNGKDSKLVDTRPNRELFRRRKDVMGHPLTMSNVIQDSNTTQFHLPREDRLELQYDYIAKISWMHVNIAFQMLNATPRYVFSHRWGYKKNGQWSGMINDLNTGRADLGTNCVAVSERLSVAVFTDSIAKFKVKFIFRQPPLAYISNIFTLPFSIDVWIAIICSIIISSITICIATKWETSRLGTDQTQLDGSIGDAMLLSISALSQQGCSKEPKKLSGRIMLIVVFTALMALYAAYSANIVVLLQAPSKAIKNLEQLAHSKMTIAALEVDYNHFVLKGQKDPVRRLIHKKVEPSKGKAQFYTLNDGVALLRQGHFAFHAALESVYHRIEKTFLETEKCDLMEVDFMNAPDPFVPVYKNSPYLELLRVAFKRIHESGIQAAQHRRIQVPKPRCTHKISAFSSVGLLNLRPVLLFMIYGIGVSVMILLAEIITHKM